jgi:hypothetical protein
MIAGEKFSARPAHRLETQFPELGVKSANWRTGFHAN